MKIKNTAEAARVYALQANDDELVNNAVEIKLHAKAKAKQMVDEGKEMGVATHGGNRKDQGHKAVTLVSVGLTKQEVNSWAPLAAVPERVLDKAITVVKERDGVLTEAAVKRELPNKSERDRDARIDERKKQQGNYMIPPPSHSRRPSRAAHPLPQHLNSAFSPRLSTLQIAYGLLNVTPSASILSSKIFFTLPVENHPLITILISRRARKEHVARCSQVRIVLVPLFWVLTWITEAPLVEVTG